MAPLKAALVTLSAAMAAPAETAEPAAAGGWAERVAAPMLQMLATA
ncbi:Uncharacterised protein [Mycobacterium tuberculosis]|nr:Uncharacterised protein [Mycobacterium tuberculosis]CNL85901.1 Uncharacterised protein [Mycobacterium tuberculosis]CNM36343.1 Uncharacterised protein [Mycobacterium tuberculosis]